MARWRRGGGGRRGRPSKHGAAWLDESASSGGSFAGQPAAAQNCTLQGPPAALTPGGAAQHAPRPAQHQPSQPPAPAQPDSAQQVQRPTQSTCAISSPLASSFSWTSIVAMVLPTLTTCEHQNEQGGRAWLALAAAAGHTRQGRAGQPGGLWRRSARPSLPPPACLRLHAHAAARRRLAEVVDAFRRGWRAEKSRGAGGGHRARDALASQSHSAHPMARQPRAQAGPARPAPGSTGSPRSL